MFNFKISAKRAIKSKTPIGLIRVKNPVGLLVKPTCSTKYLDINKRYLVIAEITQIPNHVVIMEMNKNKIINMVHSLYLQVINLEES